MNDSMREDEPDDHPREKRENGTDKTRPELDQVFLERHHVRVRLRLFGALPERVQIAKGKQKPWRSGADTGHLILIPCQLDRHTGPS